jgi:hypothetical protein
MFLLTVPSQDIYVDGEEEGERGRSEIMEGRRGRRRTYMLSAVS